MRPRIPIRLTPEEQATRALWSRRTLGACGLIALAMIAAAGTNRGVDSTSLAAHAEIPASVQTCAQWHETASGAVSHLTQTMRDADLRQVADAVFRMRRALRNCEMGWYRLACQDYQAVARSVTDNGGARDEQTFACPGSSQNDRSNGRTRMPS